jgi:glucose-1-phosphate thymidylyltransferase
MNVIIPMAGMGKRLRPHTLTTPKPLLPIAGKPIVQRLVEDIVGLSHASVERIGYVIGRFGEEAEQHLLDVAHTLGAKGSIHYQDEPMGTAHAILCAAELLDGPVTVAFADTLFRADFALDTQSDGVLWVQQIQDPRQFGVVIVNDKGVITEFAEKPKEFVSDLAMIGIYYFKDGQSLRNELQYLVDNGIMNSGEYQLPDALRRMVNKGAQFTPGKVSDWMDCGNKDAMVDTNRKVLKYIKDSLATPASATIEHSQISPLSKIGEGCVIRNSEIGPGVTLGDHVHVEDCTLQDCIVLEGSKIQRSVISNSMIGRYAQVSDYKGELSLGDYSTLTKAS